MGKAISVGASQLLLPFLEKLALSPKGAQTGHVMDEMLAMTRSAGPKAHMVPNYGAIPQQPKHSMEPWQRFVTSIPEGGQVAPGLTMTPRDWGSEAVKFEMGLPGQKAPIFGTLTKGWLPDEVTLQSIQSRTTPRREMGVGRLAGYHMDIGDGPANRELPLRWPLTKADKKARPRRPAEQRMTPDEDWSQWNTPMPMPSMSVKQAQMDAAIKLLRESGVKRISYSAEPGERSRLYGKLSGYRQVQEAPASTPAPAPTANVGPLQGSGPAHPLLQRGATMTANSIETMVGVEIDEAVEYGLARRLGQSQLYQLTDEGRRLAGE